MSLNENFADPMALGALMGSGLTPSTPPIVETPDGTAVMFLEKTNTTNENLEDLDARITFTGCFTFNRALALNADDEPLLGGFHADFKGPGNPVAARLWLEPGSDEPTRRCLEALFGGSFNEEGALMELDLEAFLLFADSSSWSSYALDAEDDDDQILFD